MREGGREGDMWEDEGVIPAGVSVRWRGMR